MTRRILAALSVVVACSPSAEALTPTDPSVEPVINFHRVARIHVRADSASRHHDSLEFAKQASGRRRDRHEYLANEIRHGTTVAELAKVQAANERLVAAIDQIEVELERLESDYERGRSATIGGIAASALGSMIGFSPELTQGIAAGVTSLVQGEDPLRTFLNAGLSYGATLFAQDVAEAIAPSRPEGSDAESLLQKLFGRPTERELLADVAGDATHFLAMRTQAALVPTEQHRAPARVPLVAAAVGRQGADDGSPTPNTRPPHVAHRPFARDPVTSGAEPRGVQGPLVDDAVSGAPSGTALDAPVLTTEVLLRVFHRSSEIDHGIRLARALSHRDASRHRRIELLSQRGELRALRDDLADRVAVGELLFEEYQTRREVYARVSAELANQGGGWFGRLFRTLAGIGGTMLGGPVLGAFIGGGLSAAMHGGEAEDVLMAAAASAGYVAGSIALNHAIGQVLRADTVPLAGADDTGPRAEGDSAFFTPMRVASLPDDKPPPSVTDGLHNHLPPPTLMSSAPDRAPSSTRSPEPTTRGQGAGLRGSPPPEEQGIRPSWSPLDIFIPAAAGPRMGLSGLRMAAGRVTRTITNRRWWCNAMIVINLVVVNGQGPDCKRKVLPASQVVRDQRTRDLVRTTGDAVTRSRTNPSTPVNPRH